MTPPTSKEMGLVALEDLKTCRSVWFEILKPVLPVLIGFEVINALLADLESGTISTDLPWPLIALFTVMALLSFWVWPHAVIRWHRFVLKNGHIDYDATWWNPDRTYFRFLWRSMIPFLPYIVVFIPVLLILLQNFYPVLGAIVGRIVGSDVLQFLLIVVSLIWATYACVRLSFILPAAALEHNLTIKEAWKMAKGMVWKMAWAPVRVTWRYIVAYLLYAVILGIVLYSFLELGENEMRWFLLVFETIPGMVVSWLYGLLYVGVLSRYYQWALQNVPPEEEQE